MLDACAEITEALRTALVTVEGSMNDFGDAQLSVDVSSFGSCVKVLDSALDTRNCLAQTAMHGFVYLQ